MNYAQKLKLSWAKYVNIAQLLCLYTSSGSFSESVAFSLFLLSFWFLLLGKVSFSAPARFAFYLAGFERSFAFKYSLFMPQALSYVWVWHAT